ncbi:MAG: DEAD/DEAH box helicase [Bacteroidales bacterium]|jgi:ATP-dependent RNA helicase RhlE|nr:DEAD/DEAH box helicase [Bacteroidales bacterium]
MKFEDYRLSAEVKRALEDLEYRRPTDIQYKAIPSILRREDVLAIAQTGTGKTAAFAIPVVERIIAQKRKQRYRDILCVIMEPTRELVIQTARAVRSIAKYTDLQVIGVLGGVEQNPQIAQLRKGVDVLVATPGRLFDLISQGEADISHLQILVLDEADHMLDLGFIGDIRQLLRHIPRERQTLFFSATISPEIKDLAYSLVHKPVRIQISPKNPVTKNVNHCVISVEMDDKRFFLERFVNEHQHSKMLVFVRTKVRAERVKTAMQRVNIVADTIHGDKTQQERNAVIKQFIEGSLKILIATDVSARGIDIPGIEFVINYDIPEDPETYVHRIGRTGRADKRGNAISYCSSEEQDLFADIEKFLGQTVQTVEIDKKQYQQTKDYSIDSNVSIKELMDEIEKVETRVKKKRK